jgi:outer membrane protein OmpA-like peptidoglycan-associated protein
MKKIFTTVLISLAFAGGYAQDERKNMTQAGLLINEENYPQAIKYLLKAYAVDSTNANINYKLGLCYLNTSAQKRKALPYLEKAAENVSHKYNMDDPTEKKAPEKVYELLGIAYRIQNKFNESNTYFAKYKDIVGTKNKEIADKLEVQMEITENAISYTLAASKSKVVNLQDSINTEYPEYTPVVNFDESALYYTGRRPDGTGKSKTEDDEFYEDIFMAKKLKDGKWGIPKPLPLTVNSVDNEALLSISPDGTKMFIGRDINGGDICESNWDGISWSKSQSVSPLINTPGFETFACISKDGNTLYFVSDRPGGLGGRDIWYAAKTPDGKWGVPVNMGPEINTKYDEESPFISKDEKTIYFSSKGHKTMGGFDIFKSTFGKDGKWSEPENLKAPINTTDDDLYYTESANGKRIYFSSTRPGGHGDKDLWMIDNDGGAAEKVAILKGNVTYDGSTSVPDGAHIGVSDKTTGESLGDVIPNKSNGSYVITVHPGVNGKTVNISYEATGFPTITQSVTVPANGTYDNIEKALMLKTVNMESHASGTISVSGTIKDAEGKPVKGGQIVVKNNITGLLIATYYTTPDSGAYYFVVKSGENYNLSFEAEGYLFQSANVNVAKQPEYSSLKKNIVLEKLTNGAKIVLNNIFFDSNKSTLRSESNVEMDKLYSMLQGNPSLAFEVDGHTDNKGNAAANLSLSQQRAQSVVDALIKKGIDKKRLSAKGFGSTMPIAPNTTPDGKPDEAGMQMNRRVEIKIIQKQ